MEKARRVILTSSGEICSVPRSQSDSSRLVIMCSEAMHFLFQLPVLTPRTAVSGILHGDQDPPQSTKSSMATQTSAKSILFSQCHFSLAKRGRWAPGLATWRPLRPALWRVRAQRSALHSVHARRRRSQVTVGWASPIDIQTCSRIVAALSKGEQIAWKSRNLRREECTSVFLRILRKRQRAVTSTCHSTFSPQSQVESFSSRLLQSVHEWLGISLSVARSRFWLFRTSRGFSRASREQADGARVSCAHAQGLFWCEHVDRNPRPHIAKKCRHLCRKT